MNAPSLVDPDYYIGTITYKLLGRILEVRVPDVERLSMEPSVGAPPDPHPM